MNIYFEQKDSELKICVDTEQKVEAPVLVFSVTQSFPVTAACLKDYLQGQLDTQMEKLRKKMTLCGYKLGRSKKRKPKHFSNGFKPDEQWDEAW